MRTVTNLEELLDALAQGETECATHPNAAQYLGVGYLKAMLDEAQAYYPDQPITLWVDCGDAPARAMEAMQAGLKHLVVNVSTARFNALKQQADHCNVAITNRGADDENDFDLR